MESLHYKDVVLVPQYSDLLSRENASTVVTLGQHTFTVPVVPSNMKCTIDISTARMLSEASCFYIMHRFDIDVQEFVSIANSENWKCVSISCGVNDSDVVLLDSIYEQGHRVDFITVDIAHGHHLKMKNMLTYLQKFKQRGTTIIAGNVVTSKSAEDLVQWGADVIKVGIGQGYVCTTKDKTGFTMPMFSCVLNMPKHIPVIADGGIRCNGDIAKAIVAGARMVMCGSVFARLKDSPSACFKDAQSGETLKEYYGSASFLNKKVKKNIEGRRELIHADEMSYLDKIAEIREDLQSAISYAGGRDITCLRQVSFLTQRL